MSAQSTNTESGTSMMSTMNSILFAACAGLGAWLELNWLAPVVGVERALALAVAVLLPAYGVFFSGRVSALKLRLLAPLAVAPVVLFTGGGVISVLAAGLLALAWVRSFGLNKDKTLRRILAEAVLLGGGAVLCVWLASLQGGGAMWLPGRETTIQWALAFWLFFLIQALYAPLFAKKMDNDVVDKRLLTPEERCELASRRAQSLLAQWRAE